jgi:hypothetical protein
MYTLHLNKFKLRIVKGRDCHAFLEIETDITTGPMTGDVLLVVSQVKK